MVNGAVIVLILTIITVATYLGTSQAWRNNPKTLDETWETQVGTHPAHYGHTPTILTGRHTWEEQDNQ